MQEQEQARPSTLAQSLEIRRRGVIVVHGIGEQRRGETLNYMGRPLVDFVEDNLGSEYQLRKEVRFSPETGSARATLYFVLKGQEGEVAEDEWIVEEEWRVVEAWWAGSFIPSPKDELLVWAFVLGWRHVPSVIFGFIGRFFTFIATARREGKGNEPIKDPRVEAEPWKGATEPYLRTGRPFRSRVWDFLGGMLWLPLYIVAYALSLVVLVTLYLLAGLPVIGGPVGRLQEAFSGFLVHSLGDQHAMTRNRLARDSASTMILDVLQPWVDPTYRREGAGEEAFAPFESVTVVAHSGGGIPAFDALTSPELRAWLASLEGDEVPALTFYTLGSGINAAFTMEGGSALWGQTFPQVLRWVDLWTQYDPVPAGPIRPDIIRLSKCGEFVDLRVSNNDNPFSDHSAYFGNQTEVLTRVLDGVLRGRSGLDSLRRAVADNLNKSDRHRRRVAQRAWVLPLSAMVVLVLGLYLGLVPFLLEAAYNLTVKPVLGWFSNNPRLLWPIIVVGTAYVAWRLFLVIEEARRVRAANKGHKADAEATA